VAESDKNQPERRAGFTPITWRMLDAAISGDAALLLIRLRRHADENETNGHLEPRDIAAVIGFHQLKKRAVSRQLDQLVGLGLLEKERDSYRDVEFLAVCRSADARQKRRDQWKTSSRTYSERHRLSNSSAADSADTPSPSLSIAPSLSAASNEAKEKARRRAVPRVIGEPPEPWELEA
jgi:hypothetical protein